VRRTESTSAPRAGHHCRPWFYRHGGGRSELPAQDREGGRAGESAPPAMTAEIGRSN